MPVSIWMPCGASPNYHTMKIPDQIPRGGLVALYCLCLCAECESFVPVVFFVYFYHCFFLFSATRGQKMVAVAVLKQKLIDAAERTAMWLDCDVCVL